MGGFKLLNIKNTFLCKNVIRVFFILSFFFIFSCGNDSDEAVSKGHRDAIALQCQDDPDKKLCGLEVRKEFLEDDNEYVTFDELNKDQKRRVKMECVRTKKYGLVAYNNCLMEYHQAALDGNLTQTLITKKPETNIEKLEQSVVFIFVEEYNHVTEKSTALGGGSGVIVSNNFIATNCHVALLAEGGNQTADIKRYIWVKNIGPNSEDKWALATIDKKNIKNDICIIKNQPVEKMFFEMKPITKFVKFNKLRKGAYVRAMGSPGGLIGHTSDGSINWLGKAKDVPRLPPDIIDPDTKIIVHGAKIAKGSSGGPLFDKNGYIIGLNTLGLDDSAIENIAVSADHIRELLRD